MLIPLWALSWGYKRERAKTIKAVFARQDREGKPRDLEEVIEIGDEKLRELSPELFNFPIPAGIGAKMHDLYFPSPLTLAAFKNELDIVCRWMDLGLGGACTKTIMPAYRPGNDRPRIQDVTVNGLDCLINAMGLPGHGVRDKVDQIKVSGILNKGKNIGLSVGGSSLDEYKLVFNYLNKFVFDSEASNTYFEINISCPNTPDGQQMSKNPGLLDELLYHMRSETDAVIGVKLSPDFSDEDLRKLAYIVSRAPKTYLNLGNTTLRTCSQVGLQEGAISIGKGGLSGPALYPRTLGMVKHIREYFSDKEALPIKATGGIGSAEQVIELQKAGANIVGMANAVVKNMYCVPTINRDLAKYARRTRSFP